MEFFQSIIYKDNGPYPIISVPNKDKNVIDVYLCSMYKARQNGVVNPYLDVRSLDCLGYEVYLSFMWETKQTMFFTINIDLLIIYINITVITNST